MPAIKDLKFSEEEKDAIILLNKEVVKLQTKITCHVKDGNQFPALREINRLDPGGSYRRWSLQGFSQVTGKSEVR